ncbi:MAG: hypothetical protein ABI787_08035 [Spartobacteria bacterium]
MKTFLLFSVMVGLICYYFGGSAPHSNLAKNDLLKPVTRAVAPAPVPVIAAAPASYERWKTGPTAQNDWKTGPNAQTRFEPFAPSEHANWNQTPGYTIVSGGRVRR